MSECRLSYFCQTVRDLLRQLGVEEEDITTECGDESPCEFVLTNVRTLNKHLNPDNAGIITEAIKNFFGGVLPIDTSSSALERVLNDQPFLCPELGVDIYQPCAVKSCAYHTPDNKWTRNCILYYMSKREKSDLDPSDVQILLWRSSTEIRTKTNRAKAQLQHWALREKAKELDYDDVLIHDTGCAVCGKDKGRMYRISHGFMYCSRDCYNYKRPVELKIEKAFGLPVKRVLELSIANFVGSLRIRNALMITKQQLRFLLKKHDMTLPDFS